MALGGAGKFIPRHEVRGFCLQSHDCADSERNQGRNAAHHVRGLRRLNSSGGNALGTGHRGHGGRGDNRRPLGRHDLQVERDVPEGRIEIWQLSEARWILELEFMKT